MQKRFSALLISLSLLVILIIPSGMVRAQSGGSIMSVAPGDQPNYLPGQLIIGLRSGISPMQIILPEEAKLMATPAELSRSLNTLLVSVPAGKEEAYRQQLILDPNILFVEFNYLTTAQEFLLPVFSPNDPYYAQQYGPQAIGAPLVWETNTGSSSTILAIIDSGVDRGHPEFRGRLLAGRDFIENDSTPQDECGHGTHVAGIAAAAGDNGQGIAGINWQSRILPIRVLDKNCTGPNSAVAAGIIWAVDQGAKVINLSLGSGTYPNPHILESATYYAYSHGATVIAAAGNNGTIGKVMYPAQYPWVLSVGMTDSTNTRDIRSSYGVDLDVMAPGVNILSTSPLGSFTMESTHGLSRTYGVLSGSSMAAAHVSGAAAILAAMPGFDHPDKIYEAFENTALDLGAAGWDIYTGYGLIQLDQAITYTPTVSPPPYTPPAVDYDYASSLRCSNVPFEWIEVDQYKYIFLTQDSELIAITLPFPFTFGGVEYTQAQVSDNGYLTFDMSLRTIYGYEWDNDILPGKGKPNQILAAYWDDLNPSASPDARILADTYGAPGSRKFVIEWYRIPRHLSPGSDPTELSFEIILYEGTGEIRYQYKTLMGPGTGGDSASIGLEYADGLAGVQVALNQPGAVKENSAIRFLPVPYGTERYSLGCVYTGVYDPISPSTLINPPFCLTLGEGSLEQPTSVRIENFNTFSPLPARAVSMNAFADISLTPKPVPPLDENINVCYYYTTWDVINAGGHASNMFISTFDPVTNSWEPLPTSVDTFSQLLWAPVPHFSVFGVFAHAGSGAAGSATQPDRLPTTGSPRPLPERIYPVIYRR